MTPKFINVNGDFSPPDRTAAGPTTPANQVLRIISSKLHERMRDTAGIVTSGACPDYAGYKHLCGVLQGLALAEREILDLQHTMEQAEYDD